MINPIKYDKRPIWMSIVSGVILVVVLMITLPHELTWWRILGYAIVLLLWILWGWGLALTTSRIRHTKVKKGVDPKDLELNTTYYLNGKTYAVYLGQNAYNGKYYFRVWGVDQPNETIAENCTGFYPGEVSCYISATAEE